MVIAHSVSKIISRHFKHFIKWEHMKTDFHNLMNLKAALANIQYHLLNYVIMVHVDSMIIRSVLSDQQKPMVVGELKKIIGPKLVICDYLNKIKYMQTVNKVWHQCRNRTYLLPVLFMTDKYASCYTY